MSNVKRTFNGSTAKSKADRGPDEKGPFSLGSAFGVTLALSVLLWWLPVFGQMIAGYAGGRKSGSVSRGLLVSSAAMILFVASAYVLSLFGVSVIGVQGSVMNAIAGSYPALADLTASIFAYIQGFFVTFGTFGSEMAAVCMVTIVFGAVGGIMSGQVSKERAYSSPAADSVPRSVRSADGFNSGRSAGFDSFDDYVPLNGMQTNRLDPSVSGSANAKKAAPEVRAEESEDKGSPLSSVLQMSDRKPAAEKQMAKEDFEYI